MLTDAEITSAADKQSIVMVRLAAMAEGAKFARRYGRVPTKAEYAAHIADQMSQAQAYGEVKDDRVNRRVLYEMRIGFEQGCKGVLEGNRPEF